jgi:FkbM family methyltransferase
MESWLVAGEEPGASLLRQAWAWHCWHPRWLPSRVSHKIQRWSLHRYSRPVLCRLTTGQQFLVRPDDLLQCEIGVTGEWEGLIYRAIRPLVTPGSIALDIGAHVGYSTILFADWVGHNGKVYCFEPVPAQVQQIEQNLKFNGYQDRVVVHRFAISDRPGLVEFYYDRTQNTGMGSLIINRAQFYKISVEAVALDFWAEINGLADVGLVKMDIEGAEILALRGMASGLSQHRYRILLIELHPSQLAKLSSSVSEILSQLRNYEYRLLYWNDAGWFTARSVPDSFDYILALSPQVLFSQDVLYPQL